MVPLIEPYEADFVANYTSYIDSQVAIEDRSKFPQGASLNIRPWEYFIAIKHGEIVGTDLVLDTGSLHTFYCIYLSKLASKVWATDSFYWALRDYASLLPSVQEWIDVMSRAGKGRIVAEEADLQKLPYPDNFFDKVVSISTIEHVIDDKKAMKEMLRVVKPNGLVLITTEFNQIYHKNYSESDGSFYRVYDSKSLAELVDGFKVEMFTAHVDSSQSQIGQFTQAFLKIRK